MNVCKWDKFFSHWFKLSLCLNWCKLIWFSCFQVDAPVMEAKNNNTDGGDQTPDWFTFVLLGAWTEGSLWTSGRSLHGQKSLLVCIVNTTYAYTLWSLDCPVGYVVASVHTTGAKWALFHLHEGNATLSLRMTKVGSIEKWCHTSQWLHGTLSICCLKSSLPGHVNNINNTEISHRKSLHVFQ